MCIDIAKGHPHTDKLAVKMTPIVQICDNEMKKFHHFLQIAGQTVSCIRSCNCSFKTLLDLEGVIDGAAYN